MFFFSCVPSSFSSDCLEGICRNQTRKEKKEILAIKYITSPHAFSRYILCTYCEVLFLEYCAVKLRGVALASRSLVLHPSLSCDLTPSSSTFRVFSVRNYCFALFKQINIIDDEMSLRFTCKCRINIGLLTCVYMIQATSINVATRQIS